MKDHLWSAVAIDETLSAWADYKSETHQFEVTVKTLDGRELHQMIPATYEPRFGIDISDMDAIIRAADKLAEEFEP